VSKAAKRERQKQNRELARAERERMVKRQRQMKTMRTLLYLLAPLVVIAVIISLVNGNDSSKSSASAKPKFATIETTEGNIVVQLDTKNAPLASGHFVDLVKKGYYDNKCIDRAAQHFVIQGGSPNCDAKGGEGHPVTGEVPKNHYPLGSLAAAKAGTDKPGTFDSSFFIVTGSGGKTLANDYARFGKVVGGLDVAQSIEKLAPASGDGPPTKTVTITKVTIANTNPTAATTTTTTTTAPTTTSSTSAP
jgi:peptidyl-prolyl cis-trans isomerase B (cyclophilin B)